MTSIEWLIEEMLSKGYFKESVTLTNIDHLQYKAEEMHKKEIIDAFSAGEDNIDNDGCSIGRNAMETYYQETFVSKGSDDHISDTNEMVEVPKQKISDESWEGCDGCTEQDEVMYKNGYVKGYNAAIAELPKEISDEEIEKAELEYYQSPVGNIDRAIGFRYAIKWYREQLKQL
jgi:hypothetical protein